MRAALDWGVKGWGMTGICNRFFRCTSRKESGASLVEMALVTPFLVLLVFGIVESSWLIARSIDVSTAAREAGRMAGVNDGTVSTIGAAVCDSMDNSTDADIALAGSTAGLGGDVTATVTQEVPTLTGLLDPFFSPPLQLTRTATFHLEVRTPVWTDGGHSC